MKHETIARVSDPLVTLVVPVLNEADAIDYFFEQVDKALPATRLEMLFVDDGSSDATLRKLVDRSRSDPRVLIVSLSRNFGKEAALSAGLSASTGDVVIPVDVDLQDPISVVLEFIRLWKEGYDVVYGVRDRASDSVAKRVTANWFYWLFNRVSSTKMPAHAGDFRLLDRRVVDALNRLPERVRFMKGLFNWVGYKSTEVRYKRVPREFGKSKFNAIKLWGLALDGIFSFSSVPLRIWSYVGAFIAIPALAYAIFIVGRTLIFGTDVPGYASLVTIILGLGGVQLISLGVIGEYLSRIFAEVKGRPAYIVAGVWQNGSEQQEQTRC
jgi:glycosyltransferase involved in cell wall biosynthesis